MASLRKRSLASLPDLETLAGGLEEALSSNGISGADGLAVIQRRWNRDTTTAPTEIVRCRLADGRELTFLCKYSAGRGRDPEPDGHRGGVAYEAEVYRQVLVPLGASTPTFYGAHVDPATGDTWLIIEYIEDVVRLTWLEEPDGLNLGFRWMGRFHAAAEAYLRRTPLPFLLRLDTPYYLGWLSQAAEFAERAARLYPWFPGLLERFREVGLPLLSARPTLVHGMCYSKNLVARGREIRPIDWEAAGWGAGELDLATLSAGWPDRVVAEGEQVYREARWPAGHPDDFPRVADAARVFLGLRWLVESPESRTHKSGAGVYRYLRAAGIRTGLV